jgi:hypothetical protein
MKPLALTLCLMLAVSAHAATINFDQPLTAIDGKPIMQNPQDPKSAAVTLGDVAVNALETQTQDDAKMTGLDKFKLDALAHKIYKNKAADLTPDEVASIKDRIGKIYPQLFVGAAWRLLDPSLK